MKIDVAGRDGGHEIQDEDILESVPATDDVSDEWDTLPMSDDEIARVGS